MSGQQQSERQQSESEQPQWEQSEWEQPEWQQDARAGDRVDERLARLLDPGPRHASDEFEDLDDLGQESDGDWLTGAGLVRPSAPTAAVPGSGIGLVRRLLAERLGGGSFGRSQLAVIVVIVLLGLGLAGWSVLRARPVALASAAPTVGVSTPTPSASATPGQPSPAAVGAPVAPTTAASPTAAASSAVPMIKVQVLGAVRHPGVVALPAGSRVVDAIDRVGGTTKSAVLGDLNLAQPLADGQQIFIARQQGQSQVRNPVAVPPAESGADPTGSTGGAGGSASGGSSSESPAAGQPIDLNTATLDQLDQLPNIGPVTAQKIIDWRTQHGHFDSVDELEEVEGIGPKTYADLAPLVTV